ncbi:tRNA dimethylallyltransferase, mitochondrial [Dimargaris verticillata]|uniref:tRNA dimethylallyltransferase, mitochondrial n=1 Tax=Dimargaris verticillata TaxID=2761393 RepID=A0A9W8B006_9FUNG|nr:tRNA dimethylallyltransferase, mitochondrial [Dimargaris verticillata]
MPAKRMLNHVVAIVGSTGVGKSKFAVELAKSLNGEVINADAMQMYKGFDVITNKATAEECQGVPHHLLGFMGVDREYTVVDFERDAIAKIAEIHSRQKVPILVGGTHYYMQSTLWHQSLIARPDMSPSTQPMGDESPIHFVHSAVDARWRGQLTDLNSLSNEQAMQLLRAIDPPMAEYWHPNDRRKIQRSLQVYATSGKPHSAWIRESQNPAQRLQRQRFHTCIFWVYADRHHLNSRLDARVDDMTKTGMYQELDALFRYQQSGALPGEPHDYTRGIKQAIGLKEFQPVLTHLASHPSQGIQDPALADLRATSVEAMKLATRQYAKRQQAWITNKLLPLVLATQDSARHTEPVSQPLDPLSLAFCTLDANDLGQWSTSVQAVGIDYAHRFMAGSLPDNVLTVDGRDVTGNATMPRSQVQLDDWRKYVCTECTRAAQGQELVLNGPKEWSEHLRSRRHKKALRYLKLAAVRDQHPAYQAKLARQQAGLKQKP